MVRGTDTEALCLYGNEGREEGNSRLPRSFPSPHLQKIFPLISPFPVTHLPTLLAPSSTIFPYLKTSSPSHYNLPIISFLPFPTPHYSSTKHIHLPISPSPPFLLTQPSPLPLTYLHICPSPDSLFLLLIYPFPHLPPNLHSPTIYPPAYLPISTPSPRFDPRRNLRGIKTDDLGTLVKMLSPLFIFFPPDVTFKHHH